MPRDPIWTGRSGRPSWRGSGRPCASWAGSSKSPSATCRKFCAGPLSALAKRAVQEKEGPNGPEFVASPELTKFLAEVNKSRANTYVVFLIHPNGADNFFPLRVYVKRTYKDLDMGWEPFSREWVFFAK